MKNKKAIQNYNVKIVQEKPHNSYFNNHLPKRNFYQ